jgi:hypothetical protein
MNKNHSAGSLAFGYVSGGFGRGPDGRFSRLHRDFVPSPDAVSAGERRSRIAILPADAAPADLLVGDAGVERNLGGDRG